MGDQIGHHDSQAEIHTTIKAIEDEVLELEKQESDLLARLRLLQDSIAQKRALAGHLKNSLVPVYRLPNEIMLACFEQAVLDWLEKSNAADERVIVARVYEEMEASEWPCTPVVAISHVSHHWRQLAIHMPVLWTNLIITPSFGRHLGVFRDFLQRVGSMPIAANFRGILERDTEFMEAIVPLLPTQLTNQPIQISGPLTSTVFSRLTSLTICNYDSYEEPTSLTFARLRCLLSATPQLKNLQIQQHWSVGLEERADKAIIDLPELENLTLKECSPLACKLLGSLSAPKVHQIRLLRWSPAEDRDVPYLFLSDNDVKKPKFPQVRSLTVSSDYDYDDMNYDIIRAFPRITHLTLHNPGVFCDNEELSPPAFQLLQHLTIDLAFKYANGDPYGCFTFLPRPQDRATPLQIYVFDSSDLKERKAEADHDRNLFYHYRELQRYGKLDERSSRLIDFLRWQADGEPEL
ncbi:hypothetical protein BJ138DRAFT_627869 [Hygrophoropsis aurantiaca]|uniref:Uncharacterized protein n=1 Tax=Hygrophoropsis aurantiaca TaxID=72124 RepID=A0ACB8A009_9AGAM|nr:hypothetical protein BJ138DRAFT_627869 [Hygrophoropsis aurantiaca]